MAQILIPFGPIVDDLGALVAGATVNIASVKNPVTDADIAGHGAGVVASADGLRVGVLYDVAAKGEAWITLDISKAGSTITGLNRYPVAFAPADPQAIASAASSSASAATSSSSADGKLTTQRLTNLDSATPTRLGILDRLASMMEQVAGLWRWTANTQSQAPVGQVQLVQGQFKLVADEAGSDGVLESYLGDTRTLRCQLTDGTGVGVDVTSATLAAKLVDLAGTVILDSAVGGDNLTLTTLLASEGRLEIVLPLSDSDLVAGRRYKLLVYRTVSARRSTFPLDVLIGG